MSKFPTLTRRGFLGAAIASATLGCGRNGRGSTFDATPKPATPAAEPVEPVNDEVCVETEDNIEGPFFTRNAPNRAVLANDKTPGTPVVITGRVLDTRCRPIGNAVIEIWQANHKGEYDNEGFKFRGTMKTDADGSYRVETIIPGRYLNGRQYRPAHIHAKVHAKGFSSLTTQLYFPKDPYNDVDPFFKKSLLMATEQKMGFVDATFDFVVS